MVADWILCTSGDGDKIRVNLANATIIAPHKKGTRIRFCGSEETHVDVKEAPAEIATRAGLQQHLALDDDD